MVTLTNCQNHWAWKKLFVPGLNVNGCTSAELGLSFDTLLVLTLNKYTYDVPMILSREEQNKKQTNKNATKIFPGVMELWLFWFMPLWEGWWWLKKKKGCDFYEIVPQLWMGVCMKSWWVNVVIIMITYCDNNYNLIIMIIYYGNNDNCLSGIALCICEICEVF